MIINELVIPLVPGVHVSGALIVVPYHVVGTSELLVLLNKAFAYATLQYDDVDSTHIRIRFDASVGDILTVGLLSGYSYGHIEEEVPLRTPASFGYARDYAGTVTLGLPVVTTDPRVTHLHIFRSRGGVVTKVGEVANGVTSLDQADAKIGDEYFVRPYHSPGRILGPASGLVRVLALVSRAPRH